jgi:hypothetical protein
MPQYNKPRKLTPAEVKEEDIKMQNEVDRIGQLDPNSKPAKRRAAFFARCKISDTKLHV